MILTRLHGLESDVQIKICIDCSVEVDFFICYDKPISYPLVNVRLFYREMQRKATLIDSRSFQFHYLHL